MMNHFCSGERVILIPLLRLRKPGERVIDVELAVDERAGQREIGTAAALEAAALHDDSIGFGLNRQQPAGHKEVLVVV
jgi:hypothetical protein